MYKSKNKLLKYVKIIDIIHLQCYNNSVPINYYLFWTISPGGKMRVLYGRLLTSKEPNCMQAMKDMKKSLTYYSDEGLFIPSWGNFNEVYRELSPYWGYIRVTNKSYSKEKAEGLWKSHPEIWVRRPDLLPGFTAL